MCLYDKHLDWHFYWSNDPNNPNAQSPWQERTISDGLESEQAPHQAFKQMLDALDMWWSKVMHRQMLAIETASQHGLNHAEIASMSKHVISALDDCYIMQLLPVTLKVTARFGQAKVYHVKLTQLPNVPGFALDQLVNVSVQRLSGGRNHQQWETMNAIMCLVERVQHTTVSGMFFLCSAWWFSTMASTGYRKCQITLYLCLLRGLVCALGK
jgi:hypothetical protein